MKSTQCFILALWLLACGAHAAELAHSVDPFHRSDKNESYEIHTIRPALPGDVVAPHSEAQAWLDRFAAAVEEDEAAQGHINPRTKPHEDREMEQIRKGRWPLVVVTRRGDTKIVVGFTIEVRYSPDELLSFQHRFKSVADIGAPLSTETTCSFGFVDKRSWADFLELRDPYNSNQLDALLLLRPWTCGEVGEIKKFYVSIPDPLFLVQAVHQAMVDSEVLRVSRVLPNETDWLRYQFAAQEIAASNEAKRLLSQLQLDLGRMVGPQPDLTEAVNSYFRENLFNPAWQPFVRISKLYTQISGPEVRQRGTSAKARLLERLFGLPPEPRWTIKETDEIGTAGILTRIYEFSVPYYERQAAYSLKDTTQIELERELVYDPSDCPRALSTLENHLRSQVRRGP